VQHLTSAQFGTDAFVFPAGTDVARLDGASPEDEVDTLGGIDVGMTSWSILLVGNRADTVTITNMTRVSEGACAPPLAGIYTPNNLQGEEQQTELYIQVDAPAPTFVDRDPRKAAGTPFFPGKSYSLPKGKTEKIVLRAVAAKQHCRFRIQMEYVAGGGIDSITISKPNGQPFEVTAPLADAANYRYFYLDFLDSLFFCFGRDTTDLVRVTPKEYSDMYLKQKAALDAGTPSCAERPDMLGPLPLYFR
jgi:hypothetical protein